MGGTKFVVSLPAVKAEMHKQEQIEPAVLVTFEPNRSEWVVFLVVDRNELTDMDIIMNIVKAGSFDGGSIKVLPFDSKTKDRILDAGADLVLVLLFETIGSNKMMLLGKDLERDFRTSFLPIIFLKECNGDRISFQADSNALKYGKTSEEDELYEFIRQVIQGREAFGMAMMKRWLEKAEAEMGTQEILLDCLNNIAIRVQALENALVDQVMENILSLNHSLKGGTGTLRMSELYQKICDMEAELIKEPYDMEKVRKEFSSAKEMLALIPNRYFDMERLQLEKQKYTVSKLQILVVDDNMENRKLIGHILNGLNLNYKDAENGEVALEMLHSESFNMVILDSQMPVMDGITTLKQIRGDSALKGLHVIMQTASTFEEDIQEFFQAGCDDYISKPVDLEVIRKKLAVFIAQ